VWDISHGEGRREGVMACVVEGVMEGICEGRNKREVRKNIPRLAE
jgi:hypothetical protein